MSSNEGTNPAMQDSVTGSDPVVSEATPSAPGSSDSAGLVEQRFVFGREAIELSRFIRAVQGYLRPHVDDALPDEQRVRQTNEIMEHDVLSWEMSMGIAVQQMVVQGDDFIVIGVEAFLPEDDGDQLGDQPLPFPTVWNVLKNGECPVCGCEFSEGWSFWCSVGHNICTTCTESCERAVAELRGTEDQRRLSCPVCRYGSD